jgi:hypothetical protein
MKHGTDHGPAFRAAHRIVVTAALLLLPCCGGAKDDSAGPLPCTNLSFTRALTTSPAAGDVYFSPVTNSCSSIDVAVNVANLSGIYTVGFDLTFPAAVVGYQSYSLGPLLLQGNPVNQPIVVVQNSSAGELQVAMSRRAPDASVSAVGSVVLIIFHFIKVASGSGSIDFDSSQTSLVPEQILDQNNALLPASFGPGHGGTVLVP